MLDILVRHNDLTAGSVTIALDGDSALNKIGGDWPLSVDHPSFDYLHVIMAWIKLSPLQYNFCHIKGH